MKSLFLFIILIICSCRVTRLELKLDNSMIIEREIRTNGKVKIDTININIPKHEKDSTNNDLYPYWMYNDYCPSSKHD